MSQALLDLVNRFGGEGAVEAMAERVGLTPEQTQAAMAALMPAVAGGMAKHVEEHGPDGLDSTAAPATQIVAAQGPASDEAVDHGGSLLGRLFGGHEVTGAVTAQAAQATGLDAGKIAALLPMVATLAAGALGHAGGADATSPAMAQGGIGGMLSGIVSEISGNGPANAGPGASSVLTSLLGSGDGAGALDSILGMIRR